MELGVLPPPNGESVCILECEGCDEAFCEGSAALLQGPAPGGRASLNGMSDCWPLWCSRTLRTQHLGSSALALAMAAAGLPSCSEEGVSSVGSENETNALASSENTPDNGCLWETNELDVRVHAEHGQVSPLSRG